MKNVEIALFMFAAVGCVAASDVTPQKEVSIVAENAVIVSPSAAKPRRNGTAPTPSASASAAQPRRTKRRGDWLGCFIDSNPFRNFIVHHDSGGRRDRDETSVLAVAHGKVGGFEYIITFFKTRSLQNNIKPFRSAGILKLPLHAVVVAVHDGFV